MAETVGIEPTPRFPGSAVFKTGWHAICLRLRAILIPPKGVSLSRAQDLPFGGPGCVFFWRRGPESNRQSPFRDLLVFETSGLAYVPTPPSSVDDLHDLLSIVDDQDPGVFPERAF